MPESASPLRLPTLCLLLAAAAVQPGCAGAAAPQAAADPAAGGELVVERGDFARTQLLTGELRAQRAVDLLVPKMPSWQVQLRWMVDDGTDVRAGEAVIEFDSSQFTSDLEEKRLALREQENELERLTAQGEVTRMEKRFAIEQKEAELAKAENRADVPPELVSQREYQELQLALRTAELELAKARAELAAADEAQRADLAVKRLEIEGARREIAQAEQAVDSMTLTAPEDGIFVVQDHMWEPRKLQVGDMVHRGHTVARLPELSSMEVEASLSDVDDGRVAPGMAARCTLDAYPDRAFPCRVTSVSPVARESNRNSLLRFFKVTLALDEDDPSIMRPGMSVKAEVLAESQLGVLLAPRAALDESARPVRARLAGGSWAEVEVGPCGAHRCVVTAGLDEGARLARVPAAEMGGAATPAGAARVAAAGGPEAGS
jgi:multidrug resistance efflux pump